jgi:hypothetical protein
MTKAEAEELRIMTGGLEAIHAGLKDLLADRITSWSVYDLRRDLDRWERELRAATNAGGQHYSEDTIRSHIGHSAQFIRWLAGEWQPHGPRDRL